MIENQKIRPAKVIGPLGEPLTIADLPSPKTKRWVVRRKAEVVADIRSRIEQQVADAGKVLPASYQIAVR